MRSGRQARSSALGCVLLCVAVGVGGCGRVKQQMKESMDNNPQMRQAAIDSARKSCVDTATAKAPKLPGIEAKINTYCECFATKGLGKFSNSELASIGIHGGHFTTEQQGKLNEAVAMCSSELLNRKGGSK